MEYTQWDFLFLDMKDNNLVLILVVMEYTQWDADDIVIRTFVRACLNPCCNGIYSMRLIKFIVIMQTKVLILVVMEYTQWGQKKSYTSHCTQS